VEPAKYPKPDYQPRDNEFDAYNWSNYEAEEYKDAPISLQASAAKEPRTHLISPETDGGQEVGVRGRHDGGRESHRDPEEELEGLRKVKAM
jgi:hypothetical protein